MTDHLDKQRWFRYYELSGLCYLYQAIHLAIHQEKAFEQRFKGWVHGPINLYIEDNFKELINKESSYEFKEDKIRIFNLVKEYLNDFDDLFYIKELCSDTKAYKKSREGLDRLDPGEEFIDEGLMYDEFSTLLKNYYICPKCDKEVYGSLSSEDSLTILECDNCDIQFIYTNKGEYFIKE